MPRVSEFTKAYDVTSNTVRAWATEFGDYLSPGANPGKGKTRVFTDEDGRVIAQIANMRRQAAPYSEIHNALADGYKADWPPRPPESGQNERSDGEGTSTALVTQLTATIGKFEGQLDEVKAERDHLRVQLVEANDEIGQLRERAAAAEAVLERIDQQAVISVVHSQATQEGIESTERGRPWWKFWGD